MKKVTLKLSKYEYELLMTQLNAPICNVQCFHETMVGKMSKKINCDNCPMYTALAHIKQMLEGKVDE